MVKRAHRVRIGVVDDLREYLARFGFARTRDGEGVDADLDRMVVAGGLGPDVVDLLLDLGDVLPLVKYQSETRAAMSRAARELPPWKISGSGPSGFGFSE